jgi:hypothetical protein
MTTTERDELALILVNTQRSRYGLPPRETTEHCSESCWAETDAILAAGYRKPRTVTAVEELDALPVGAVIRTAAHPGNEPRIAVKDGFWKTESEWFVADGSEWCLDSSELDDLPATVLFEGHAS